jgi:hypothetical protein
MCTSPRVPDGFRGPRLGCAVEEGHFLTRIAMIIAAATVICMLARVAASPGWSSVLRLADGATCLMILAAAVWTVSRLGHRHLVLAVDRAGVTLGPGLWAYLRHHDRCDVVAWRQIRQVELFTLDYSAEPHNYSLIRLHVRVSCRDGRQAERALPVDADGAALEQALRAWAPRLLVDGQVAASPVRGGLPRPRGATTPGPRRP